MKLSYKDVQRRIIVKLDKSIKADGVNGLMTFGEKNDYPFVIESIINGSISAKSIADIYAKFLIGKGFEEEKINDIVIGKDVNSKQITVRKLLRQVASSLSYFNGVYIHTNLNLTMDIVDVKMIPFKNCRFAKIDDRGYTAKVGVHPDWGFNNSGKLDKSKIVWYNMFTRNEQSFTDQVKHAGDIKNYKGQVYFMFLDTNYLYPLSPFDAVHLDCDTEQQVSIFKNNMTRNGMLQKTIARFAKPANEEARKELEDNLSNWLGADGFSLLALEDEIDPVTGQIKQSGAFAIDSVNSNIDDALFAGWQGDLTNNIRKANKALPSVLIDYDESKLGTTSGEGIIQATNFYNAMTKDDRDSISEMFKELLSHFDNPILKENTNWKIKPLTLYDTNIQPTTSN
jgi:hypothetical protein